jgi:hypothetical protein
MATATMPAPATSPADRDTTDIASPATYARNSPVWIYRGGAWRPGLVVASSERAALVEYRYTGNLARGTDTAIARDLAARHEYDPDLDPAPPTSSGEQR